MDYSIYKLEFSSPVHFGKTSLSESEYMICSDTLFSALCIEALGEGEDLLNKLVSYAKSGELAISDAFPYIGDKYLLPKPRILVDHDSGDNSSIIKKAFKKLKYLGADDIDSFLDGSFDVLNAIQPNELGVSSVKVSASVRNMDGETVPYDVGLFRFNDGCGLYVIAGFTSNEIKDVFDNLMKQLQFSGLGGRRSSGFGRFSVTVFAPDDSLLRRLEGDADRYMLLNTALPQEDELSNVLSDADYSLVKRSGFVSSFNYSASFQRKKDLVMFRSGSCFARTFEGDIYDVSTDAGSHPVFRYGKPMFLRINV